MTRAEKAQSALVSLFPSKESLRLFLQNKENTAILDSILQFALRNGLMERPDTESLELLLDTSSLPANDFNRPQDLTFEDFLEKKAELLQVNLSLRALTARINALLDEQKLLLPKITNSMLTRLKKEPADTDYKKNVLRSLAFWLGYERRGPARGWNYETLLGLCAENSLAEKVEGGARIGFAVYSRGDVIDHEILGWLKKTVKSYIDRSISHFSRGRWGKVRSHDITTIYIDFPGEQDCENPGAYRSCLHGAVSLAHQIAIKWSLSRYCTKNRFLSIGIVAGEFVVLDNYLLPILNAKLPNDPVIRVSEYARQCLLINDIRVLLCPAPAEANLFNGEVLYVWWIDSFWTTLYLDFVSELLEDPLMQNSPASMRQLDRLLWKLPEADGKREKTAVNAVSIFLKSPSNSMLGVELAKTLYYRRRFEEALQILQITLSLSPRNLVARTLRMTLLANAALEAPDARAAECFFRQAEKEACFIQANCACEAEDFYCEYAMVNIARAMSGVRNCQARPNPLAGETSRALRDKVFSLLDQAEDLFEKALTVSPSGIRSAYLLLSVRLLQAMLRRDEEIFSTSHQPFTIDAPTRRGIFLDTMGQIGLRRANLTEKEQREHIESLLMAKIKCHDDAITLESYRPTIYFCYAVALVEVMAPRSDSLVALAIDALRKAVEIAGVAKSMNMCIYSVTNVYSEMIPAGKFIDHLENCLDFLQNLSKAADSDTRLETMMMLNFYRLT